jgi:hypothetical protein
MNGYIEAGYAVVLSSLGVYGAGLSVRRTRLLKSLRPLKVKTDRREQAARDEPDGPPNHKWH